MIDYKRILKNVKLHPEEYIIIHYSCQSLYDDNEGLSPRITSIVVMILCNRQTISFATHAIAEELGILRDKVIENYDLIERELLEAFYKFVTENKEKKWIHWNMNNITYGFEHIEHRYRKLTLKSAPVVLVENRINLDSLFRSKYGNDYVQKPRMAQLMDINGGRHRHFLTGPEEVNAFKSLEFIKMHNSTLCKVNFFEEVIELSIKGKLNTKSKQLMVIFDRMTESRAPRIIGGIAGLIGLISSIVGIYQAVFPK